MSLTRHQFEQHLNSLDLVGRIVVLPKGVGWVQVGTEMRKLRPVEFESQYKKWKKRELARKRKELAAFERWDY